MCTWKNQAELQSDLLLQRQYVGLGVLTCARAWLSAHTDVVGSVWMRVYVCVSVCFLSFLSLPAQPGLAVCFKCVCVCLTIRARAKRLRSTAPCTLRVPQFQQIRSGDIQTLKWDQAKLCGFYTLKTLDAFVAICSVMRSRPKKFENKQAILRIQKRNEENIGSIKTRASYVIPHPALPVTPPSSSDSTVTNWASKATC